MGISGDADAENIFAEYAAAFVRGRVAQGDSLTLSDELLLSDLHSLLPKQWERIYSAGRNSGMRLNKFKRTMGLARVAKVLGILQGLSPKKLLDVGSGRGAFLWPLLDHFPSLEVTAIDRNQQRASDLNAVQIGGIDRLTAYCMDVTDLDFTDSQFDVVTALEVLEHIPNYESAIREVVRVAKRFVIVSVPSKPDNNPEHIHLLTKNRLQEVFQKVGCQRVSFDSVLNHLIVVATVNPSP